MNVLIESVSFMGNVTTLVGIGDGNTALIINVTTDYFSGFVTVNPTIPLPGMVDWNPANNTLSKIKEEADA